MVKAEVDQQTNSLTITVRDCDVVIVGQSSGVNRQSCRIHNYREDYYNDNVDITSMSKNRILESEETFTM